MANTPHGGALKDLLIRDAHLHDQLVEEARELKDIFLTEVSGSRGVDVEPHEHDDCVTAVLNDTSGVRT